MIAYVDINGKGYTEEDAQRSAKMSGLAPIAEALADGQVIILWEQDDQLIDPDGQESGEKERLVVSVSSSGFVIEWVKMSGIPTYRMLQLNPYHNGWLLTASDEDTKDLGLAMSWFSFMAWRNVMTVIDDHTHLVRKTMD